MILPVRGVTFFPIPFTGSINIKKNGKIMAFCWHSALAYKRAMTSNSRTRSLNRTFFLLRWVDYLRVPTNRNESALERSERIKDIVFSNNLTNDTMKELLLHAFSDHLDVWGAKVDINAN